MKNTALFIGHSHIRNGSLLSPQIDMAIQNLICKGCKRFYNGGYGEFDLLCAQRLSEIKKSYPDVESILVQPYPVWYADKAVLRLYDQTLYPRLEGCPQKFAIVYRNRWMVEQSDAAIAYVRRDWGGAARTLEYARRKGLCILSVDDAANDAPPDHFG